MILLAAALTLPGAAHAGLRADLDREFTAAPELAVVCTSASEALTRVRQAAAVLGGAEPVQGMVPFLEGIAATFAPDARVAVAWWNASQTLRLGFDTRLTAPELAGRFAALEPGRRAVVFEGPRGWGIREFDGTELLVAVQDGWAQVTRGPGEERAPRSLRPAMLAALPETAGCVVATHVEDDDLGAVDVAAHLSFTEGQPATFVATLPGLTSSEAILLEGAVPPTVRTPEQPQAVAVLGIGLDSIDFSTFLTGKELRQARRVQNQFPVTGGTTLALLQLEPAPRIAATIPFSGHMPARKVARRTLRLARLAELDVERVDATHLTLQVGELQILAAASANRLDLSTDPGALNAMQQGVGEPWVTGAVAELAAAWPLVVSSRILPSADGLPAQVLSRPLYVALDIEDALLKGVIDVPLPLGELGALASRLDAARKARKTATPEE